MSYDTKIVSARDTLQMLAETRRDLNGTVDRLQEQQDTARQTLKDIACTLNKIDDMKARWGAVLDGFAKKVAKGFVKPLPGPDGSSPTGQLAHGFEHGADGFEDPVRVVKCDEVARPKMMSSIPAHEYNDTPAALAARVRLLADMLRRAKHCALYTGAGISTAAGIKDYASKAGNRSSVLPKNLSDGSPFDAGSALGATPTYAHRALVALHKHGMIEGGWVQQNHDGLPQKAGLPQSACNEIHGSWFDPSNPVVPMSAGLRLDLVRRLNRTKDRADLVIAMGTSLSGVSADQIVSDVGYARHEQTAPVVQPPAKPLDVVSEKSTSEELIAEMTGAVPPVVTPSSSGLVGAVIINVQQTRLDGYASLRIFATCDEVMRMLATELALDVPTSQEVPKRQTSSTAAVSDVWRGLPYDATSGERLQEGEPPSTLDLAVGVRVKLVDGNAPMAPVGLMGRVSGSSPEGHYSVVFDDGKTAWLGRWMLEAAAQGVLERLPLVVVKE